MSEFRVHFNKALSFARDLQRDTAYQQCPNFGYHYVRTVDGMDADEFESLAGDLEGGVVHQDKMVVGCYVGAVLHAFGVPIGTLALIRGSLANSREHFADAGILFSDKAFKFLDDLQALQDNRATWADAFRHAEQLSVRTPFGEVSDRINGLTSWQSEGNSY